MSHLLDVNFLLACVWESHAEYARATRWLDQAKSFATCPITEMGFLRVSLGPAFRTGFADTAAALQTIVSMPAHRFLSDRIRASQLPPITTSKDVTDAHLVMIAKHSRLKLATFDVGLCHKEWARGIAEDPTRL